MDTNIVPSRPDWTPSRPDAIVVRTPQQQEAMQRHALQLPSTLPSEKVVLSSPLSFHGSAARIWKLSTNGFVRWLVLVWLVAVAWSFVAVWYGVFGLLVVPFRLIRRGQRKRKLDDLRHRELLSR